MLQSVTVSCRGGLDLSSNVQELLQQPGVATILDNFECSTDGGYRRIDGYEERGTLPGIGRVRGLYVIPEKGILVARNDSLYHSIDALTWTLVSSELSETSSRCTFQSLENGSSTEVLVTDGTSNPVFILIEGDVLPFTFTSRVISLENDLRGASYSELFKRQYVIAGMDSNTSSIYYSSLVESDVRVEELPKTPREKFDGATSGFIDFGDKVVGLKSFREVLYVFCDSSIWKVQGMAEGQPVVAPVTRNMGCIDGATIQEVAGNIIYLARDGLRTVAATERIDDVELGTISGKIQPLLKDIIGRAGTVELNSVVIRDKSQYRLFYSNPSTPSETKQDGIICSLIVNPQSGQPTWSFSTIRAFPVSAISLGTYQNVDVIYHTDFQEKIYEGEQGYPTFNGRAVKYTYEGPYSDLGDIGVRKNIHTVGLSVAAEGSTQPVLEIRYDYLRTDVAQPFPYLLPQLSKGILWGDFDYGTESFGSIGAPDRPLHTEGSGHTVALRLYSRDGEQDFPFELQSFIYELIANGRI